jgi:hypothetical protein
LVAKINRRTTASSPSPRMRLRGTLQPTHICILTRGFGAKLENVWSPDMGVDPDQCATSFWAAIY